MKNKVVPYPCTFAAAGKRVLTSLSVALFLSTLTLPAQAETLEWVSVGHPGNAPNTLEGVGYPMGEVADEFLISKYEVTNTQYAEFLNSVDPDAQNLLELYNWPMEFPNSGGGITMNLANASGEIYVVTAGFENKPVVFATWYSAIRFANWMNNGQGTSDTETGAYEIEGGTPIPSNFSTIERSAGAVFFLPNRDEWYKAGYFDGSRYFNYPTGYDETITCTFPTNAPNSANCGRVVGLNKLTLIGSYAGSPSPYGTYDQAGNASEWVENAGFGGGYHQAMGGSFNSTQDGEYTGSHGSWYGDWSSTVGFRIARAIGNPQCDADLDAVIFQLEQCSADLDQTLLDLDQVLLELDAATADTDGDSIRDTADACPSTSGGFEVDALGCSQTQFCESIDASGGGRAVCNSSDWGNDEPLADNPGDCKASRGICYAR